MKTTMLCLLAACLILLTAAIGSGEVRIWTSSVNESVKIEGEYIETRADGNIVIKQKSDGQLIVTPPSFLIAADQAYIKNLKAAAGPAVAVPVIEMDATEKDRLLRKLESNAKASKTAEEAVVLYTVFVSDMSMPADVREKAGVKLLEWKDRADKALVRLGMEWVSVEEAKDARVQADYMVKEAIELFKVQDDKGAFEKLQRASSKNPNDITADFMLACGYALVAKPQDFRKAETHFNRCLQRDPTNVAVLNNIGLAQIRLGLSDVAVQNWTKAAAICRDERMVQNIKRLKRLSSGRMMQKSVPEGVMKKLNDLYTSLVVGGGIGATTDGDDALNGWQYLMLPQKVPMDESEVELPVDSTVDSALMVCADGIVIAPGYVLTTRSATKGQSGFLIADPADPTRKLKATLVASSKDVDLALLSCETLTAPAAAFDLQEPRRSATVFAAGYPPTDTMATQLKFSSHITRSPIRVGRIDVVTYDATNNATAPSVPGGPVVDEMGNVIAMHWTSPSLGANQYSAGIPAVRCLQFIREAVPTLDLPSAGRVDLPSDELKKKSGLSTVVVLAQSKAQDVGMTARAGQDCYFDPSCCKCNGTARMDCPDRGCKKGVYVFLVDIPAGNNPITGAPMFRSETRNSPCLTCQRRGSIPCLTCAGTGVDPTASGALRNGIRERTGTQ